VSGFGGGFGVDPGVVKILPGFNQGGIDPTVVRRLSQDFGPGAGLTALTDPAAGQALLKRLLAKKQLADSDEVANIRWGKASRFTLIEPEAKKQPSVTVIWPDDDGEEEEPAPVQWTEISRTEETIRVENPDDAEQYVMVARATSVLFRKEDDGTMHQFNFNYPA
jgi:hypothetical protein